jgi:hypothetical protein
MNILTTAIPAVLGALEWLRTRTGKKPVSPKRQSAVDLGKGAVGRQSHAG